MQSSRFIYAFVDSVSFTQPVALHASKTAQTIIISPRKDIRRSDESQ